MEGSFILFILHILLCAHLHCKNEKKNCLAAAAASKNRRGVSVANGLSAPPRPRTPDAAARPRTPEPEWAPHAHNARLEAMQAPPPVFRESKVNLRERFTAQFGSDTLPDSVTTLFEVVALVRLVVILISCCF